VISVPAQSEYFVFVAQSEPTRWSWELRRRSQPMGIKVSAIGFQSRQAAEFAGARALSEFLAELSREERKK
jgi:hypothetical protein